MRRLAIAAIALSGVTVAGGVPWAQQPVEEPIALARSGIAGATDPALRAAVIDWLQGGDAGALPALADLANADNLAAQLFLGAISARGQIRTPWFDSLDRDAQRAIERRMDSRFGTPWLTVAAEAGSPLGALLRGPEPGPDGNFSADPALELAALGEPRVTVYHLTTLVNQGYWAEAVRLEQIAETYGTQWMAWAAATNLPGAQDRWAPGLSALRAGTMDGYSFLRFASPENEVIAAFDDTRDFARLVNTGRDVVGPEAGPLEPEAGAFLDSWLAKAQEASLLRRWCDANCPGETAPCAGDLYALMFGRAALPYMSASPLESLVPQETWEQTPRSLLVLEQYALHMPNSQIDPAEAFDGLSVAACVKNGLADSLKTRN